MPAAVVSNLNSTAGIVAVAAAAVAVIALLSGVTLLIRVRQLRAAQRVVLGDGREDLVAHAAALQTAFEAFAESVSADVDNLGGRVGAAEGRLDGAIAHRSLIRYDAYDEMSGHQSLSIALLDATGSGVVLSSIHHRDSARLYAKQIRDGRPEQELSPEEAEAVRDALAGGPGPGA